MPAVLSIVSRHGVIIEACCRNQLNHSKLALCKSLLYFFNHLKQLYIYHKTEHFSCKVGVAYLGLHVLRRLTEELVWVTDKWLQVINNTLFFKTVIPLMHYRIKLF